MLAVNKLCRDEINRWCRFSPQPAYELLADSDSDIVDGKTHNPMVLAAHRFLSSRKVQTSCNCVEDVKRLHGGHFFDAETMAFFKSRTYGTVFNGSLFVTSERFQNDPRQFSIRYVAKKGNIGTFGDCGKYSTLRKAVSAIQRYTKQLRTPISYIPNDTQQYRF